MSSNDPNPVDTFCRKCGCRSDLCWVEEEGCCAECGSTDEPVTAQEYRLYYR